MYNVVMDKSNSKSDDTMTPFAELCRFADSYGYKVELDKPFTVFNNLILKIFDSEGNLAHKVILDSIEEINQEAGKLLNTLSKKKC
jgi:hypothetical protein